MLQLQLARGLYAGGLLPGRGRSSSVPAGAVSGVWPVHVGAGDSSRPHLQAWVGMGGEVGRQASKHMVGITGHGLGCHSL